MAISGWFILDQRHWSKTGVWERTVSVLEVAIQDLEKGYNERTKISIAQVVGWLGQVLIIL